MSKPIYEGANVTTTDTFSQWLNRTNQIVYDMSTTVVTTGPYPQPNTINGAWTSGNAHIEGVFSANAVVASGELRGGTVSTPATLYVGSNTIFNKSTTLHIQPNTANFTVNANTSLFTGNFEMSNTSKTFVVSANSTTIGSGPINLLSNTTVSAANLTVSTTNTFITSNTTITANNTVLNSNLSANGGTTHVRSANTTIGDNDSGILRVVARVGRDVISTNSAIQLGNTSSYFGNTYLGNSAVNGVISVSGSIRGGTHDISDNLNVTSNAIFSQSALVHIQPNTALFRVDATNTYITGVGFTYENAAGSIVKTANNYSVTAENTSIYGVSANSKVNFSSGSNITIGSRNSNVAIFALGGTINVGARNYSGVISETYDLVADNLISLSSETANLSITNVAINSTNLALGGSGANNTISVRGFVEGNIIPRANTTFSIGDANTRYDTIFTRNVEAANTVKSDGNISSNNNITSLVGDVVANTGNLIAGNTAILNSTLVNGVAYIDANKRVVTTSNFTYDGNVLTSNRTNTTNVAISTNASANVGGNLAVGGNETVGGNLTVAGNTSSLNATITSIPVSRIPYTTTGGLLSSNSNFTYNGTLLTVNATNKSTVVASLSGSANVAGTFLVTGLTTLNGGVNTTVANTDSLRVRNLTENGGIAYTTDALGNIGVSNNFVYEAGILKVTSNNALGESIVVSGGVSATGNVSANNVVIRGSTEIVGDLVVRGITTLSSDVSLIQNEGQINYLTVGPEFILSGSTRLVGSLTPKVHNTYDLGMANTTYRTVYANNFVGNVSWSSVTDRPTPTITLTGAVSGNVAVTEFGGNVSISTVAVAANATANGVVTTGNQTFAGTKTFSSTVSGSINGNANTATRLQTARTINGTSFDGSGNITTPTRIVRYATNNIVPLAFIADTYENTANNDLKDLGINNSLTYNIETGTLVSIDFNSSSDERWKTNIKTIDGALDLVKELRGVSYDRIDTHQHHVGVIAQEVEKVVPEVVNEDDEGYKYVSYGNLVGVLIEAVKELTVRVETLEKENAELKDKN